MDVIATDCGYDQLHWERPPEVVVDGNRRKYVLGANIALLRRHH